MIPRTLTTVLAALLTVAGLFLAPAISAQDRGPFDLLIQGGRVLDGTGNPWFQADIGVRDGRIVAIGRLQGARADRVVDARGLYVSPGFIDIHSHADDGNRRIGGATIRTNQVERKAAPNVVSQGVTTVVVNHDGRSPWPISDQRSLLETQGVGPNVMMMVGHGTVRRQVMGDDFQRPTTPDEILQMRSLVRRALAEGAVGMSAGLEYVPGRWSTTDEVAELAEELVAYDAVYISHERSEGADPMWYWPSQDEPGPPTLQDAIMETIEIGRRSGARVVASHIKAKGAHYWGSSGSAIQLIQRARDEGVRIFADQYPYATSGSDGNTVLIPRWALTDPAGRPGSGAGSADENRRPPADVLRDNLADSETETMIRRDIAHEIRRRGGAERVMIMDYPDEDFIGKTLREVADLRGQSDMVQMAIDLQLEGDPDRRGGRRPALGGDRIGRRHRGSIRRVRTPALLRHLPAQDQAIRADRRGTLRGGRDPLADVATRAYHGSQRSRRDPRGVLGRPGRLRHGDDRRPRDRLRSAPARRGDPPGHRQRRVRRRGR